MVACAGEVFGELGSGGVEDGCFVVCAGAGGVGNAGEGGGVVFAAEGDVDDAFLGLCDE
ncbi:Uncharacterised protein [Dermatophilus congolensis]|uniref:Uncharacterized protein n=1 Tax=Dermatophilus congolensis TaxID=1863 RepID=A0AA46BQ64_9MICO|nr:Uncharacterised protein [Dermatophilus congolensis]